MLKKSLRLAIAFMTAASSAFLPAAAQPAAAGAASTGTLFALSQPVVYKADPATGALTPFASLPTTPPTQPSASFNNLASDPVGHRLFIVRTTFSDFSFSTIAFQLITVDTKTAATQVSPDLAQPVTSLVFDPASGSLFGQNNMCCPFQIVRIDPATGAETHFADMPGVQPLRMAVAPAKHAIYFATESFLPGQFQPVVTMVTVDISTGAVSQSPVLARGVVFLAYDTASDQLFGKTFCCPANMVRVDPVSGSETTIASGLGLGGAMTIDSATHTIYSLDDELTPFSFSQFIQSINDQTGAIVQSTGSIPSTSFVSDLAFEGIATTPESMKQDVRTALASGAIDNAGVANSLLAELDAASAARSRGQCATAANAYQAFINEVTGQSGKHVAAATAAELVSEAQFLIANCP